MTPRCPMEGCDLPKDTACTATTCPGRHRPHPKALRAEIQDRVARLSDAIFFSQDGSEIVVMERERRECWKDLEALDRSTEAMK